ncbi:MAG: xanthine dehydrogenase small subunit [Betaproteobacteria bacterium]|nr:xanthine dehydrogenase small subunit [Betaproteobacteria bacterium]
MTVSAEQRPIRFLHRGKVVSETRAPADRTLLEYLRQDLGKTGTKEGCAEGDCGACTVVLAELNERKDGLRWRAVNSCLRFVSSIDGLALYTVEDLRDQSGALHPVQQAIADGHGTQCGFCTPGFVMSLFALYQEVVAPGRGNAAVTWEQAQGSLSGNLCRCTGYRPLIEAAQKLTAYPVRRIDEARLLEQLRSIQPARAADLQGALRPSTLPELLALRKMHPEATVIAGCTDIGIRVTKKHEQHAMTLDVTAVPELSLLNETTDHLKIGAAARLQDAFALLERHWPQLHQWCARFASVPIRNSATLGGNIVNASPLGDSMALLIALGASVTLRCAGGSRSMPLEDFYTGMKQVALRGDEVLTLIRIPKPQSGERVAAYKISKRFDQDISAVCLALRIGFAGGIVRSARIGASSITSRPSRARRTEAALIGQPWNEDTVGKAVDAIRQEFEPTTGVRASAGYRRQVSGNLLQRFWLESQAQPVLANLEGGWQ